LVFAEPSAARAASAGLFVAQAADVVSMAPGTNIGSAHPIQATGAAPTRDPGAKVRNDAVTRVRNLATMHGRNADWAEQAVRNSVNINAEEAVRLHVADLEATDIGSLLSQVDGRSVPRANGSLVIHSAGAVISDNPMPFWQVFLNALIDPTIAALLIIVAGYGIITELSNPGLTLAVAVITLAFFVFFIRKVWTARRQPAFVGGEAMLGAVGEVREELAPEGLVFVQGALWKATAEKPIPAGSTVRVVGRQGLELQV